MSIDLEAPASTPVVSMRGVSRTFGEVHANERVDLDLYPGEVHALLGENGAGKSTLMAVLTGLEAPDEGVIFVKGEPVSFSTPMAALAHGIGMVHQEFRLFDGMTVAENICAGWEGSPRVFRQEDDLFETTRSLSDEFGIEIDAARPVWQLSVGEKQRVELLRMLARGLDVLILDEPTAVLTPEEADVLFQILGRLKERGKAVVLITHKLPEVVKVADRLTVMRAGKNVATQSMEGVDPQAIAQLMIGREVARTERMPATSIGESVLEIRGVTCDDDQGLRALHGIDVEVRGGEIVGIVGVAGNGQRELIEVLAGTREVTGGTLEIGGRDLTSATAKDRLDAGIGVVPEERKGTGLAADSPIWMNAILRRYRSGELSRAGMLRRGPSRQFARELIADVDLSTSDIDTPAGYLSGGHAQRLLVGREVDIASQALVLAYPTRGLDVAAVEKVRTDVLDARDKGIGVLMVSEDMDEIFGLADRVLVIYEGQIVGSFDIGDASREVLGRLMAGVRDSEGEAA